MIANYYSGRYDENFSIKSIYVKSISEIDVSNGEETITIKNDDESEHIIIKPTDELWERENGTFYYL